MLTKTINKKNIFIFIFIFIVSIFAASNIYETLKNNIIKNKIANFLNARKHDLSRFYVNDGYINGNAYIAHGGGINEYELTNSLEALTDSIKRKFKFIEIDMMVTSDGKIIGAHDWKQFKELIGYKNNTNKPINSNEIRETKINNKYTPIMGNDIYNFMIENDFVLVTDKIKNYDSLVKEIPLADRMIVEVFSPDDYLRALQCGIKYPAFGVYTKEDFKIAQEFKFPIITMNANCFFNDEETINNVKNLHNSGVTILLFSMGYRDFDNPDFLYRHLGVTVSKVYSKKFSPNNLP